MEKTLSSFLEEIELKYTLSFNTGFGAVSAELNKPEELANAYKKLKTLAEKLDSKAVGGRRRDLPQREKKEPIKAKGETARILEEIETKLLKTEFFSKPRTTGETKSRLFALSHKSFTSRKVSQALGILRQKRILKRVGRRNHYAYSK